LDSWTWRLTTRPTTADETRTYSFERVDLCLGLEEDFAVLGDTITEHILPCIPALADGLHLQLHLLPKKWFTEAHLELHPVKTLN